MKAKAKKLVMNYAPNTTLTIQKLFVASITNVFLDEGANVVMLEPDVAKAFVNSAAVNDALRSLLDLTRTTQRLTKHSSGRAIARR